MKKISLLGALIIFLSIGLVCISEEIKRKTPYEKEGFTISYPYNMKLILSTEGVIYAKKYGSSNKGSIISSYYYMENGNTPNYYFFTLNTFDLTSLFANERDSESVIYSNYFDGTLEAIPKEWQANKTIYSGAPALEYSYMKDLGDGIIIPTKAAIICKNRKAYYIEVSAVTNLTEWFNKVQSSISFYDFSRMKYYIILFSIGIVAILFYVIRAILKRMKRLVEQENKITWVNIRAYALYKYIIIISLITILTALFSLCFMYGEIISVLIILELLLKTIPLLLYVRNKASMDYFEDYLVPQWFKNKFYKYLRNRAELRALILFLFMPIFYIATLPFGTFFIFFYTVPICLLAVAYLGFRWINQGRYEPL